jgi:hypothetical protein
MSSTPSRTMNGSTGVNAKRPMPIATASESSPPVPTQAAGVDALNLAMVVHWIENGFPAQMNFSAGSISP